ncbi:MAG: thiamine-phosphate kinase [Gemmatimonadota bacterium]
MSKRPELGPNTGGGSDPAAGGGLGRSEAASVGGLGGGREFDLIRSFFSGAGPKPRDDVRVGPGDDCAVVAGDGIVLTADLSVEGVHFRREWLTPFQIGFRGTTASLSDLAAMAARPIGVLASLAIPADDFGSVAAEVMRGVTAAVEGAGGVVLGGDVTGSLGPLVVDVIGVGEASDPVLRSGARAGDEVWVTGELGGAAAAVAALARGAEPDAEALVRFAEPVARVRESLWLHGRSVQSSLIDLSDGLGGDAGHIARASGATLVLEEQNLPIHPAATAAADEAERVRLALSGGEDYELCFTAAPGAVGRIRDEFGRAFGLRLTMVGMVEAGEGVVVLRRRGGEREQLTSGGFQHFRDG